MGDGGSRGVDDGCNSKEDAEDVQGDWENLALEFLPGAIQHHVLAKPRLLLLFLGALLLLLRCMLLLVPLDAVEIVLVPHMPALVREDAEPPAPTTLAHLVTSINKSQVDSANGPEVVANNSFVTLALLYQVYLLHMVLTVASHSPMCKSVGEDSSNQVKEIDTMLWRTYCF